MVALQTNMGLLSKAVVPNPFSWEYIRGAYEQFLMTHTVAAVCVLAYVVVTLLIIAFLIQPKIARTWTKPSSRSERLDSPAKPDAQDAADLHCAPVVLSETKDQPDHSERRKIAPGQPQHMGPLARKTDKITLHPSPVASGSAAILYIADNDSSDHQIESLSAAGFVVISSLPGKNAIHHITISKFDLVVIDTLIAEAARLCATRLIEALPATPPMPILILANTPSQTLELAATNACFEYLFRPFDEGFLHVKINTMLAPKTVSEAGKEAPLPYDRHMEKLIESLPATVDEIHRQSEQNSLNNIELHSGVITALGEDASKSLQTKLSDGEMPLPEEIQKTADKVDELLRLCATVKPPRQKN
jgi:DNA-binding response OmpR family regulator